MVNNQNKYIAIVEIEIEQTVSNFIGAEKNRTR